MMRIASAAEKISVSHRLPRGREPRIGCGDRPLEAKPRLLAQSSLSRIRTRSCPAPPWHLPHERYGTGWPLGPTGVPTAREARSNATFDAKAFSGCAASVGSKATPPRPTPLATSMTTLNSLRLGRYHGSAQAQAREPRGQVLVAGRLFPPTYYNSISSSSIFRYKLDSPSRSRLAASRLSGHWRRTLVMCSFS